ncbi:fumarylacetoacetate hydrolase family protein [Roseibium aggregatum]|uniref:fumarylacetoacetate hydrolase family protein n=1 Tax=Roseibium aggregatum TaxID=187304 RepID=UPI001E57356E|nr:fumarylacetoacetate hydrolase family protein [Roseibium aggregatum]UES42883.1 2-hydroxyhepta-2,4-diene-1,7-dioate isomerase [Roseibium aggregatum]
MTAYEPAIAAFRAEGALRYGVLTGDDLVDVTDNLEARFSNLLEVVAAGALPELVKAGEGRPVSYRAADVAFQIPITAPQKIICVGVNYPDRNAEYKDGQAQQMRPSLFPRFASGFTGHGQPLIRPPESDQLDYEGEIAIVIGKAGRRIPRETAFDHIAAITLCNEGTIRDWTRHAKFNVTQGKNWERTGSIGPALVPLHSPAQLQDVALVTRVNGEVRQQDRTSRMIFDFPYIVNYVSTFAQLMPGDILVCGTPTGAGARMEPPCWLKPGDIVEVEADGIGILRNGIEDEKC